MVSRSNDHTTSAGGFSFRSLAETAGKLKRAIINTAIAANINVTLLMLLFGATKSNTDLIA